MCKVSRNFKLQINKVQKHQNRRRVHCLAAAHCNTGKTTVRNNYTLYKSNDIANFLQSNNYTLYYTVSTQPTSCQQRPPEAHRTETETFLILLFSTPHLRRLQRGLQRPFSRTSAPVHPTGLLEQSLSQHKH